MKPYPKMNSKNTALLVIDIVNGCCHKDAEKPRWNISFSKIRRMVPKLARFIDNFRKKIKGNIIFIKITPWKRDYLAENIIELYNNEPKASYYSDDNTGFLEDFYLVKPKKNDIVLIKNTYDAFANSKLKRILNKKEIKYLVITGVFTDGCVLATICGGFQSGFNFVILKDLIETIDIQERQEMQKHLKEYTFPIMYGKTITSRAFLDSWK